MYSRYFQILYKVLHTFVNEININGKESLKWYVSGGI